jgi:hypothetical protein
MGLPGRFTHMNGSFVVVAIECLGPSRTSQNVIFYASGMKNDKSAV